MSFISPRTSPAGSEGWAATGSSTPTLRQMLLDRGSRRWVVGASVAAAFLIANIGRGLAADQRPAVLNVLIWLHVLVFLAAFMFGPPLSWRRSERGKILIAIGFFLLSLPFFAYSGPADSAAWLWTYVAVFIGVQTHERAYGLLLIGALGVGALVIALASGMPLDQGFGQPATIASVGMMMGALSRQLVTIRQLNATRHELAELAVAEERNRLARDMHDILGHSLTVIAVKAELAGKLIDAAPDKAKAEIADVEDLARSALADVRSTVSGYRGINVISELAAARSALAAAGIEAEIPGAADMIRTKHRELVGWVLREGTTNVIRHSKAQHCTVTLSQQGVTIDDDGVGPGTTDRGNGLHGLAERAASGGATLTTGRSPLGGFRLRLTL
ncbi:MAG: sensor histidine kinase [Actinomycetales bacterium]